MKLTLPVKLAPTPEQHQALLETMERFNEACNDISKVAYHKKTANKIRLQKIVYYRIREQYGLSAQMTVRAISKVAEVFKRDKSILCKFKPHGAMIYDPRILSWKGLDRVSILTLKGRQIIPIQIGPYQEARFDRIRGQTDLLLRNGVFYLAASFDAPEPEPFEAEGYLGVDLGIKNIAVDGDGDTYVGGHLNGLRSRHVKIRSRLQSKGTKSAKRLLRKRSGKEHRCSSDVNHVISKRIVAKAKDTRRGIALEDLTGIRERITVRRNQRRVHHSWAFYQLRSFIEYKARLAGVPIVLVDPRDTSRTCPSCGHVSKGNRPDRDSFRCQECGLAGPADYIAAVNIGRVPVNGPYVSGINLNHLQGQTLPFQGRVVDELHMAENHKLSILH